jgi:hypothetical protein
MQLRNRFEGCMVLVLIYGGFVYHTRRDKMHQKALSCKNTKNKSPRLMSIHILAVDIPLELRSWSLLHHPLVQVAPPSNIYFKILKIDFTNSISYISSSAVLASIFLLYNCSYFVRA